MRVPDKHEEFAARVRVSYTHVTDIEGDPLHKANINYEGCPKRNKALVAEIKRN